jgi:hypothetical protein
MTGRPVIGIILAIVIEARHWVRFRWDFDDDDCGRAWQFSSIAIALTTVLVWLDGNRYTALPNLLSWMPALLLPMQFVQSYGMRDSLPLGIFSFLARRRRARNLRLGLVDETPAFNFGNVLFATSMIAAAVGTNASSLWFLPCLVILTGWILLASGRGSPLALVPVILLSGLLALAGQMGLERAEAWLGRASSGNRNDFDPNRASTRMGIRGLVTQSPDIVWRMRPEGKSPPPRLLRTATFNSFINNTWQNMRLPSTDFQDLDSLLIGEKSYDILQPTELAKNLPSLPRYRLRGAAAAKTPLPLPGDVSGLRDFELDGVERNSLGTVRVFPKHSVIDGTVFWKGGTNPEIPPLTGNDHAKPEDLRIPFSEDLGDPEHSAIHTAVQNLHLAQAPTLAAKLDLIRRWFAAEFRYTLNLTIWEDPRAKLGEPTVLARFLTEVRAGHCEYFATAATLMLRDAGIPTRYAKGYAVIERDFKRGEFVLRGTHGHAWCRVWDKDTATWIDFDPTPPNWSAIAAPPPPFLQRFNDGLMRLREDFFIWRNQPANRLGVSLGMLAIGLALTAFIAKRLWHTKRRLASTDPENPYHGPTLRTPLHDLETQARKHLGHRPPGQTFAQWLVPLRDKLPALDEAIQLHQQLRFDPNPPPPATRDRLETLARQLAARLRTSNFER